ncbi:heterokaryon incompatibility protein [Lasiodiplodia theobromae]|nr:heterokaryon incompatibility protein [Lasiodiplodia theobromae]
MWLQSMDKCEDSRELIGRYWTGNQSKISLRDFAEPMDRLPAISSFAEYVQKKTGDEYIAGLFRSDIHRGLMWNKTKEHKCEGFEDHLDKSFFRHGQDFYKSRFRDGQEPKDCYVAPSWSWVSTPSSSYSSHAYSITTTTVADCDIEAEVQLENEDNPFGRVKSGRLVLTSRAYRSDSMQLYMKEEKVWVKKEKLKLKDNSGFEADIDLDWSIQLGPDENLQILDAPRDEQHPLWKSQGPLNDMHLVPLIQSHDGRETFGLVIIPFPNQPDESWMRAGIFTSEEPWETFEKCPRKRFLVL